MTDHRWRRHLSTLSQPQALLDATMASILDGLLHPLLVLDETGQLLEANGVARKVLAQRHANGELLCDAVRALRQTPGAITTVVQGTSGVSWELLSLPAGSRGLTLRDHERRLILMQLQASGWRPGECARRLGISRSTLWRRLRSYGLRTRLVHLLDKAGRVSP